MALSAGVSALVWCKERLCAGCVVGHVRDPSDLRNARAEQRFDSLADRHSRQAAALTATLEAKANAAIVQADQHDPTAMRGDRGSNLIVQHLAHAVREFGWLMLLIPSSLRPEKTDASNLRECCA